ncbi:MAG TPA: chromate transporter [Dehalococcoidia bacterium]|nr:chromate transporter [Dehalococcoidia bacterium]
MNDLIEIAIVFVRVGLLAFGGGLAILPEMERQVVDERGWLTHREFVDSFALGQLTPGPGMLMVMFAGYRVAGVPGALMALVAIFFPSALLTGLAAGHWDALRRSPWLGALQRGFAPIALGLIASGAYTLLRAAVTDVVSAAVAVAALFALWRFRLNPALVIIPGGLATALAHAVATRIA